MKNNIQYLLDYKHKITQELLEKLTKKDIQKLFELFKSRKAGIHLKKIIIILSSIAPDLMRNELVKILMDPTQEEYFRILSASCLNNIYDDKTEEIYHKVLSGKQSIALQMKLIKGLGKFGTKKSLPIINKKSNIQQIQGVINLTELLISSRNKVLSSIKFDISQQYLDPIGKKEKITPVEDEHILLQKSDYYGLKTSQKGFRYKCGVFDFFILNNKELDIKQTSHMQLSSIIASKSRYCNEYYTKMLVFLLPKEKEESKIVVFRTNGLLSYGGSLQRDGSFVLRNVKKFANDQVYIKGKYKKGKLVFEEFYSSNKLTRKKTPTKTLTIR